MKKRTTSIKVKYALIQQTDLTQEDIKDLCECGNASAAEIRREIEAKIYPKTLPKKIPTWLVVEHKEINIEYIIRVANATG